MMQSLSQLSLTELCDKLSEFTARYSKSMLNGFTEKEFAELRALIEALQKEIARRKPGGMNSKEDSQKKFPPHQSAGA